MELLQQGSYQSSYQGSMPFLRVKRFVLLHRKSQGGETLGVKEVGLGQGNKAKERENRRLHGTFSRDEGKSFLRVGQSFAS